MQTIRLLTLTLALATAAGCRSKDADQRPAPVPEAQPAKAKAAPGDTVPASLSHASECNPACSSIERCDAGKCQAHCPPGEVYVPATGPEGFRMGRGNPGAFDQAHSVVLTQAFCMDETEVTVAAYRKCFDEKRCTLPQLNDQNSNFRDEFQRPDHPLNMVNWEQAKHYCEEQGKALPSEAQWEWAAGQGKHKYPWGDAPEPSCENGTADFTPGGAPKSDPAGDVGCHGGGTSPVKSHPKGNDVWPDGTLYDMAGNVWEWTSDCYLPYPSGKVVDPQPMAHPKLDGDCYVRSLRGGGWNRSKYALSTYSRAASKKTYRVPGLGFRCVRNPASDAH